jgi:hypothetical protein
MVLATSLKYRNDADFHRHPLSQIRQKGTLNFRISSTFPPHSRVILYQAVENAGLLS